MVIRLVRRLMRRGRVDCRCAGPGDGVFRNGDIRRCEHGCRWMFHADGWGSAWWNRMPR